MADGEFVSVETWNSVYKENYGRMVGLARQRLRAENIPEARVDAEDVVQDAFANVLRTLRVVHHPRGYAYATLRREIAKQAEKYGKSVEKQAASLCAESLIEPTVADYTEMVNHRITVHLALNALPLQQRTAVWATKAMGQTQEQTALDMNRSPGTIATHVARAVAVLKLSLAASAVGAVVVLCGLMGMAMRSIDAASGGRQPADPPMPRPGAGTWSANGPAVVCLGALILLGYSLFRRKLKLASPAPDVVDKGQEDAGGLLEKSTDWFRDDVFGRADVFVDKSVSNPQPFPLQEREEHVPMRTAPLLMPSDPEMEALTPADRFRARRTYDAYLAF